MAILIEILMLVFINALLVISVYLGYSIGEDERKLKSFGTSRSVKDINSLCMKYKVPINRSWTDKFKRLFIKDL